jgi:hypothetical protein
MMRYAELPGNLQMHRIKNQCDNKLKFAETALAIDNDVTNIFGGVAAVTKTFENANRMTGHLASISDNFSHFDKVSKLMGSSIGFDAIDPDRFGLGNSIVRCSLYPTLFKLFYSSLYVTSHTRPINTAVPNLPTFPTHNLDI